MCVRAAIDLDMLKNEDEDDDDDEEEEEKIKDMMAKIQGSNVCPVLCAVNT